MVLTSRQAWRVALFPDSEGNEVDLLVEPGDGVFPIEVKSGETINSVFLKACVPLRASTVKHLRTAVPWSTVVRLPNGAKP